MFFALILSMTMASATSAANPDAGRPRLSMSNCATPQGEHQLNIYPPRAGKAITVDEQIDWGLRPDRLTLDTFVYNRQSNGCWEYQLIKAGEKVFVDKDNVVRYLVSCGNRLILMGLTDSLDEHDGRSQVDTTNTISTDTATATAPTGHDERFTSGFRHLGEKVGGYGGDVFRGAWGFLLPILALLAVVLIGMALFGGGRQAFRDHRSGRDARLLSQPPGPFPT